MIDPRDRALAQMKNFAALTTLFADRRPQTEVMWVDCSDEHVLVNTSTARRTGTSHATPLSTKYLGTDYRGTIASDRVIFEVTADYVRVQ